MNFKNGKINKPFFAIAFSLLLCGLGISCKTPQEPTGRNATFPIVSTEDFTVIGDGSNPSWERATWIGLPKRRPEQGMNLETKVKALYSETGIYFLFNCEDRKLSSAMSADFMDLWTEDVVEVFLWPDETDPVYFEYEISPLNYELPIIISNIEGDITRWQPFHYDTDRQTSHETSIAGGKKIPCAPIDGWMAEFFIPFKLLRPLKNSFPQKGDRWRANFYRVDYDMAESIGWSWQPTRTNFHDYESFGTIIFE